MVMHQSRSAGCRGTKRDGARNDGNLGCDGDNVAEVAQLTHDR
jgi:hypothetical protein